MKILNRNINLNTKPFIIAEMSGNHSKSLNTALNIVEAASKSGADAIKLQTFSLKEMTLNIRNKNYNFFLNFNITLSPLLNSSGRNWLVKRLIILSDKNRANFLFFLTFVKMLVLILSIYISEFPKK